MQRLLSWFAGIVLAASLAACGEDAPAAKGPLVLAAASLQDGLEEAATLWERKGHPRPALSLAGTPELARQVIAGAPADLFIAADTKWMDELAAKDLIKPESRAILLGNRLVLIAPAESKVALKPAKGFALAAALHGGKLAVADPEAVPAGRYARQALEHLGAWQPVSSRLAIAENVRLALALVARKEAPLGVVYETDAMAEPKVRIVARLPESSHAPIVYPVAVLKASDNPEATGLREFLASKEAQNVFRRHGFQPAPAPR